MTVALIATPYSSFSGPYPAIVPDAQEAKKPLVVVKPTKKIVDMTAEECRALVEQIAHAAVVAAKPQDMR